LLVHIGDPSSNQVTTLESQVIHMIQELFGQTLRVEVENGSLTPELLREALGLRGGQIKRFLVESRNPQSTDDLVILLSKVSSQDIATFPEKLKELDGVREVTIMKKSKDHAPTGLSLVLCADIHPARYGLFLTPRPYNCTIGGLALRPST
jgi:hypothetical protein